MLAKTKIQMIKLKTLSIILLIAFTSCSKDDNGNENNLKHSVIIEKSNCGGAKSKYCITEAEKDRIQTLAGKNIGEPCLWISIKDINGVGHSGYYRSSGSTTSDSDCE